MAYVEIQFKKTGRKITVREGGMTHQAAIRGTGSWQMPGAGPVGKNFVPPSGPQTVEKKSPPVKAADVNKDSIPVPEKPDFQKILEPVRSAQPTEGGKFPTLEEARARMKQEAAAENKPVETTSDQPAATATEPAKAPEQPTAKQVKTNKQGGKNAKG